VFHIANISVIFELLLTLDHLIFLKKNRCSSEWSKRLLQMFTLKMGIHTNFYYIQVVVVVIKIVTNI